MQTLNASTLGLIPKRNHPKFLTLLSPFCQKKYSIWMAILSTLESTTLNKTIRSASKWLILTWKMQNPEWVNLKRLIYTQPIPRSGTLVLTLSKTQGAITPWFTVSDPESITGTRHHWWTLCKNDWGLDIFCFCLNTLIFLCTMPVTDCKCLIIPGGGHSHDEPAACACQ